MAEFTEVQPTLENFWRSIVLFGRNVACYKFALAKSLIELSAQGNEQVSMDSLTVPFSKHVCEHLRTAPKQSTSGSSRFLDACRKFNAGELGKDELLGVTTKLGFQNVIDAFHIVQQGEIGIRFFTDDRRGSKCIRLTQELFNLIEKHESRSLPAEIEARWRLVETAWEHSLPRHVLTVGYESGTNMLVANRHGRRAITGCRDALNGYQKGKCFYCSGGISLDPSSGDLAEVDHFFPHILKGSNFNTLIDGIWNLVLACHTCNRGPNGKLARLPDLRYLERLHRRNGFLIDSHHPLRETLILQTGFTETERRHFLQRAYEDAKRSLIQTWKPAYEHEPAI